ncbi:hypothetical protein BSKO_13640 [Bryopsis sp. KO-2023]|nr:hypothetical protein BSKO_13640 [Bryopsis sp. KO-2023]
MEVPPPTYCTRDIEVGEYDPPEVSKNKGGVSETVIFFVGNDRNGLVGRKEVFAKHCLRVDGCREWMEFERDQKRVGKPTCIYLPDLTRKGVEPCLQFVETGTCRFKSSILWEVFDAAVFLNLGPIARACVPHVVADLRPVTAWRGLENGLMMGSRDLTDEALEATVRMLPKVLENTDMTASWITSGAWLKVLKNKHLPVSESTLAEKVLDWVGSMKEGAAAVWKVLEHVSWATIVDVDTELYRKAIAIDAFRDGLEKQGILNPASLSVEDMPESMKRRKFGVFELDPIHCSPYTDVGPPRPHGRLQWEDFEGAPRSNGLHVDHMSFLVIPDPEGRLNATKSFSVETWVRHDFIGQPYEGPIVCKSGSGCGWELRTSNSQVQFMVTLMNGRGEEWHELVGIDIERNPSHWFHLLGTFDGSMVRLYVDGSMEGLLRLPDWNTAGGDDRLIDSDCQIIDFDGDLCVGAHSHAGWRQEKSFQGDICGLSIVTNQMLTSTGA